ncbi:MAG TPA: YdeI/OmpD-associated family protein [Candidatus Dormibacteraeota bacterium]|nr:YdeI/OmpD-associated family protein [Candidatus Dormibacteraeota bacterium]
MGDHPRPIERVQSLGNRGQLRVKGEINGFGFCTSLFPTREGGHMMIVNKRMQSEGRTGPGTIARFRLEPDTAERIAKVPKEFKRILAEDRSFRRWFDELSYSTRNEISKFITEVKSADARVRRAEQMAERLLATMEAERELPPVLQLAFASDARAREGWERMSPSRRRMHLFGIFYYRNPDSRSRRIDKAVQDATAFAERRTRRTAMADD